MKVKWYVINNDFGYAEGPFESKSQAENSIEIDYRSSSYNLHKEYLERFTIFPQVEQEPKP